MIPRRAERRILLGLSEAPAVALLGPRQVGKTTLARAIAERVPGSIYLDLENRDHSARLAQPAAYLRRQADRLVILDEIRRLPGLFEVLRGEIDRRRARVAGPDSSCFWVPLPGPFSGNPRSRWQDG